MYLGDSLQWNTRPFLAKQEMVIAVPEGPPLEFPSEVAADPGLFDAVIDQMLALSERNATASAFASWLAKQPAISGYDAARLTVTNESLDRLRRQGRNHIWGYVARSLFAPSGWRRRKSEPTS